MSISQPFFYDILGSRGQIPYQIILNTIITLQKVKKDILLGFK